MNIEDKMNIEEALKIWIKAPILSSKESKEGLKVLLDMPFDTSVHYPIAYLYLRYAFLTQAKNILDACADKNDETYLCLNDFYQALQAAENNKAVFSLNIPYRNWWKGPHYLTEDVNKWFPARVNYIACDVAYLNIGYNEDGQLKIAEIEISSKDLTEEDKFIEVGFVNEKILIGKPKPEDKDIWHKPKEIIVLDEVIKPIVESLEKRLQEFENSFYDNH